MRWTDDYLDALDVLARNPVRMRVLFFPLSFSKSRGLPSREQRRELLTVKKGAQQNRNDPLEHKQVAADWIFHPCVKLSQLLS